MLLHGKCQHHSPLVWMTDSLARSSASIHCTLPHCAIFASRYVTNIVFTHLRAHRLRLVEVVVSVWSTSLLLQRRVTAGVEQP